MLKLGGMWQVSRLTARLGVAWRPGPAASRSTQPLACIEKLRPAAGNVLHPTIKGGLLSINERYFPYLLARLFEALETQQNCLLYILHSQYLSDAGLLN